MDILRSLSQARRLGPWPGSRSSESRDRHQLARLPTNGGLASEWKGLTFSLPSHVTFKPNSRTRHYENSIQIDASATIVEQCFTELDLMHRWLNPALRCRPIGDWSTDIGARSRFTIAVPLLQPSLYSTVVERSPGMIVWEFQGFFSGRDRWECRPTAIGTQLINRFSFEIPNPLVRFGFDTFAARFTQADMQQQLRRLKAVAEREYLITR